MTEVPTGRMLGAPHPQPGCPQAAPMQPNLSRAALLNPSPAVPGLRACQAPGCPGRGSPLRRALQGKPTGGAAGWAPALP